MKRRIMWLSVLAGLFLAPAALTAQQQPGLAAKGQPLTLQQCIDFALANQPQVRQARIDETIGERQINAQLSGWMPQVFAQYSYNHFLKRQVIAFGEEVQRIGKENTSNILFQANQTLYSNDLLLASRAARYTRVALDQNLVDVKISTVVEVSKSYYDILLTQEQLRILDENIARQQKQYNDALARYETGLVDKTDYQRASISVNNSKADRKRTQEAIVAKLARLKQLMGVAPETNMQLANDSATIAQQEVLLDTTQALNVQNRIEYQQLQTQQQLLGLSTRYYRWGFLPTVDGFINYNFNYLNDELSQLYNQSFPTSVVGLQANIPIFQGTRRLQNLKIAQLQEERLGVELENARNQISTEYTTALSNYKSDYNEWLTLRQNAQVAREVYDIIKLQYDEGIKAYVDLVVAETDLKTAQLNYYNALFRVLSSKLDVERALGNIGVQ
ncbi:MAG: TolC family protein [Sphingobacteriales bacterium]|nr:MAG: TolC family protein [Sphingobacteriales bacterium]